MTKFLLSGLLALSVNAVAGDVPLSVSFTSNGGYATQRAAIIYGYDSSTGTLRQIVVNSSGALSTGSSSVTITSVPVMEPVGITSYNAASYTASTVNLTTAAGASVPCEVCLSSNGGAAAGFKVAFTTSATAPVALTSTGEGHYIAASASAQCWGPFKAGTHAHVAGVAATSSVLVGVYKVQ